MARIFIALRFEDDFKKTLVSIQESLKANGIEGNYCSYRNLHLTLAFIGEQYDLPKIRKAVSEVKVKPFDMSLGRLGSFPTKAGVIWCGLKDNEAVAELAERLRERLKANGVCFKEGTFFPHISLVQHPSAIITDIAVPESTARVTQIHIMKSERVDGELIYSEIK